MTRGRDGSLLLSRMTLSFTTPRRFIPAHSAACYGDMRYWWVNHNQTYRHEVQGGYLWSPKRTRTACEIPFMSQCERSRLPTLSCPSWAPECPVGIAQTLLLGKPQAPGIRKCGPESGKTLAGE